MWVSTVFGGSCVRCTSSWVLCPGVECAGVVAVGRPDAHVEVERVASGGVSGGHVQSCLNSFTSVVGGVPLRDVLLSGDPLAGAGAPGGGGPVSKVVVAGVHEALAFAFAGMSASAVKGGVAEAAVSFAVLASAVGRAHGEKEPVSEVESEVGIRHGLASGVLGRWEEEGASTSAAVALEVAGIVFGEQGKHFITLLLGGLLGEDALHLWDGMFHRVQPVDRGAIAGPALDGNAAGLL